MILRIPSVLSIKLTCLIEALLACPPGHSISLLKQGAGSAHDQPAAAGALADNPATRALIETPAQAQTFKPLPLSSEHA